MNNDNQSQMTPAELYSHLKNEKYGTNTFETTYLGEGMFVIKEVICQYWKPRFLLDDENGTAVEFMSKNETLLTVTLDDIDWESLETGVSASAMRRAKALDFHYPSFIYSFMNGVAEVVWQLVPDGMYYMDDDGFGMEPDEKENIYGFIDRQGRVLVKFRYADNDNLIAIMREEAERIVRIKIPTD